jgi:putative transposase
MITGIDQLWVADLTYVRVQAGFVFLAAVLDVFSRKCVGWALEQHYQASLVLAALNQVLAKRKPSSRLVHHSDRGSQYASADYIDRLKECGIQPSMSRVGNPYDNAYAESFMKTLKYEAVYAFE